MVYGIDPVYLKIQHRFITKYKINIRNHIDSVTSLGKNELAGFWFTPKDHKALVRELLASNGFVHDNRADFFHAMAASQTQGEGYREISDNSIHCQVSSSAVNMHIDYIGFVWRGPDGTVLIGPNAISHII